MQSSDAEASAATGARRAAANSTVPTPVAGAEPAVCPLTVRQTHQFALAIAMALFVIVVASGVHRKCLVPDAEKTSAAVIVAETIGAAATPPNSARDGSTASREAGGGADKCTVANGLRGRRCCPRTGHCGRPQR